MGVLHKVTYLVSEPRLWDWSLTPFCTASCGYLFFFFFPKEITSFISLFLAMLGLPCFSWAFYICSRLGLLFIVVCRLLIEAASLVSERRLQGPWASVVVALGLQNADSVVVVHRLSSSASCGIFLNKESNPCPLHWQADSYPLWHQGSPLFFGF